MFPCQRPFTHHDGVAELPQWRIEPGADLSAAVSAWQDAFGGGPIGWEQVLLEPTALATYLKGDVGRDWGSLERLVPYDDVTRHAEITTGTATRSGLWLRRRSGTEVTVGAFPDGRGVRSTAEAFYASRIRRRPHCTSRVHS